ncbi:MAG: ester cyclase [Rhizomicrobium sp.]|jgi:predicted ester cyclase
MNEQANLAAVRRCHDRWNAGDIDGVLACFDENTRNHGRRVGRTGVGMVVRDILDTFPDLRIQPDHVVAVGDDVIARCTFSGTHKGIGRLPVNGGLLVGVQPTGKHFEVQHIHWYTFASGLIVEHRANRDDIGMMVQLGLLPAPLPFQPPPSN